MQFFKLFVLMIITGAVAAVVVIKFILPSDTSITTTTTTTSYNEMDIDNLSLDTKSLQFNVKFTVSETNITDRIPIYIYQPTECSNNYCPKLGISMEASSSSSQKYTVFHFPKTTQKWSRLLIDDQGGENDITFRLDIDETRTDLVFEDQTLTTVFIDRQTMIGYLRQCNKTVRAEIVDIISSSILV